MNVNYPSNGTYTAYLFMANTSQTCTSPAILVFTVTGICNLSPSISITPGPNGQVTLSASSNGATGYTWVPYSATGATFATSFSSNGSYPVTLFASNGSCLDSTSATIPINSICTLTANASATLLANGYVLFQNNTTGTASPTSYTWSFGDGNTSTSWAPGHQYLTNGAYIATLTVVNNSMTGCSSTYTMLVNVNNVICNANFTYSVLPNGVVTFSSSSQPSTITSLYTWNFSGSTYSAVGNPTAITSYSANGSYPVTLNFVSGTCSTSVTYTVVVNSIIPCILDANFTYSIGPGGVVSFTNTTTGTLTGTSYTWNFGDNTTSGAVSPTHTYSTMGFYNVTLWASDTTGNCTSDTTINVFVIYTCSLQAAFAHTVGTNGFVTYSSTSSGINGNEVYNWEFGDGSYGTGPVVSHIYQNGGAHFVLLAISDTANIFCHDSIIQAVNITGVSCTADANFTLSPTSTPQYWTATPVYPWNIVSATWSWGDGSQSNTLYASHTYSAPGQYNICLTVTASCGSTATACGSYSVYRTSGSVVHVNVEPPSIVGTAEERPEEIHGVQVYPVPARDELMIRINGLNTGITDIAITDLLGKVVKLKQIGEGESLSVVNIADLPRGIYLLHVTGASLNETAKIIVEK